MRANRSGEPRPSLEVIAPSIDEAVARGASELGVSAERLVVEVLDEGGKGLLGFGVRQARVRLTVRAGAYPESLREDELDEEEQEPEEEAAAEPPTAIEGDETLQSTRETVRELLHRMGVRAEVRVRWGEAADAEEARPLLVDIQGSDLSILIGRKGETLAALQYITRLIVAKELGRMVAVVVDVEGYRARRERQLRQLARRMASQALEYKRTMVLEPMPANERRIIHLELRDRTDVYTESTGEGEHRKVTIIPRQ